MKVFLQILAAPLKGAAFALFLPAIGFWCLLTSIPQVLRRK